VTTSKRRTFGTTEQGQDLDAAATDVVEGAVSGWSDAHRGRLGGSVDDLVGGPLDDADLVRVE
jgi:hypothetical protein